MDKKLKRMGLMSWQIDMILNGVTLKTVHGIYRYKDNKIYLKKNGSRDYLAI